MLKTFPAPDKDREDRHAQVLLERDREREREERAGRERGEEGVE